MRKSMLFASLIASGLIGSANVGNAQQLPDTTIASTFIGGNYISFNDEFTSSPTTQINKKGSYDLNALPQRMKIQLGRALLRQNELVNAINSRKT